MKKWNVPVPMPTDIRRTIVPPARWSRPTRSMVPLHLPGRAAGAQLVVRAVEQQEQGVAAPLEEAGAPVVGLVEERAEHAVERVAHQLGADLALPGEPLGQRGEARDVDEDERCLELLVAGVRRRAQPVDDQPRHVRLQQLVGVEVV